MKSSNIAGLIARFVMLVELPGSNNYTLDQGISCYREFLWQDIVAKSIDGAEEIKGRVEEAMSPFLQVACETAVLVGCWCAVVVCHWKRRGLCTFGRHGREGRGRPTQLFASCSSGLSGSRAGSSSRCSGNGSASLYGRPRVFCVAPRLFRVGTSRSVDGVR